MDTSTWILELTRFIPLCLLMAYAALHDAKTGKIPNKLWLYTPIGAALTIYETAKFFSIGLLAITLISVAMCCGFGYITFLIGGGGADAKALITLGVSAPLVPLWNIAWPLPLALLAPLTATIVALPYLAFKKSSVPLWKRKLRFLPFIFFGLMVWVIL